MCCVQLNSACAVCPVLSRATVRRRDTVNSRAMVRRRGMEPRSRSRLTRHHTVPTTALPALDTDCYAAQTCSAATDLRRCHAFPLLPAGLWPGATAGVWPATTGALQPATAAVRPAAAGKSLSAMKRPLSFCLKICRCRCLRLERVLRAHPLRLATEVHVGTQAEGGPCAGLWSAAAAGVRGPSGGRWRLHGDPAD